MFIGRTGLESPILWTSDARSWIIGKDPEAGKDWRQEKKEVAQDDMFYEYHWLNGYEFGQTWGESWGQRGLVVVYGVAKSEMT